MGLLEPLQQGVGHRNPWLHILCSEDTSPPFRKLQQEKTAFAAQGWGAQHIFPLFNSHVQILQKIQSSAAS